MRVSRSERVRRASLARSSCYKCGGKWRFCRQQQRGAASDAVGQAGNPLARSLSVLAGGRLVVGRSSLLRSRRRRLQLQFRRPKNGRFKRNIFGEETDGRTKEEKAARPPGLPVSAAAKATIFGQEQAQMRAAVERETERGRDGLRPSSVTPRCVPARTNTH